jgi:hypothetical protein
MVFLPPFWCVYVSGQQVRTSSGMAAVYRASPMKPARMSLFCREAQRPTARSTGIDQRDGGVAKDKGGLL